MPVRAGEYVLGVRTNTAEGGALLRDRFADRVVDDADPPANLSLWLAPPADDGPQDLHRLYVTYTRALRTGSVVRALAGLWHELDLWDTRLRDDQVLLDAVVLVNDRGAHVRPAGERRRIVDQRRAWERDGCHLVDRRAVTLDPAAGVVHVPATPFDDDPRLVEACVDAGLHHRDAPPAPSGTWPVASWLTGVTAGGASDRLVRAVDAVTVGGGPPLATTFAALARLLPQVPEHLDAAVA